MFAAVSKMIALAVTLGVCALPTAVAAQVTAFTQAIATAAAGDDDLSAYYRRSDYAPLWVGPDETHRARREALLTVVGKADLHGLPRGRYSADRIESLIRAARTSRERGRLDVELSRIFLRFAADLQTGVLQPGRVVPAIKREVPARDRLEQLKDFAKARPHSFMDALTPRSQEYTRLIREKLRLEDAIRSGSWGRTIRVGRLEEGSRGEEVVALRDRLIAMGYLRRSASLAFDAAMRRAVESFQADHGLAQDGVVGGKTLEEINTDPSARLGSVLVALERERWMNIDRGDTHIWVNLTDFHARIVQHGETLFATRSVIGKALSSHQTPEFSDEMDHMVINPTWYVPRSIVVEEYLPGLRSNRNAFEHLQVVDRRGQIVSRGRGFSEYSASSFPFSMRQPPGPRNALGRVKFMFPNRYNIYLHDTPAQGLFRETVRAFSHGCIRLDDPYEFAHALLAMQEDDPVGFFNARLNAGREARVNLETPLPVHLVYRTAVAKPGGGIEFRADIYGRDARILDALLAAGVSMPGGPEQVAMTATDG